MIQRWLYPALLGSSCGILALPISIFLSRPEPFFPLFFGGGSLVRVALVAKGMKDKTPGYLRSQRIVASGYLVLILSSILNLSTAVLGTLLKAGLSPVYLAMVYLGASLTFGGTILLALVWLRGGRGSK